MKTCSKCKVTKPLTGFYRDKSRKDGFRNECKQCEAEKCAIRYKNSPEKAIERAARYRKNNPEKAAKACARWYKNHSEKIVERSTKWAKNNPEKLAENHARWRAKNVEKIAENSARWAKNNQDKINSYAAKRRASELQATPLWADHKKIDAVYRLADMLSALKGVPYHVDHIYPLRGKTVCGLHVHQNLQALPSDVNIAKSNKMYVDVVGVTVSGPLAWVGE